ncbi:hypothetical protein FMEXI_10227 [Fusarium mexicanum]|uniref:Uncharacterized protein n=1 Tax=Fusarium mexicanum TaxID=751941 RepID=A0A8H5IIK7_9HYPO|nr:hypothetical protein FMEXI_10227 [Fusarium mexicanum]
MSIQSPVQSADELRRSVFATVVESPTNASGPIDFGSLQFGIGRTAISQIIFVALYRSRANEISDISQIVEVSVTSDTEFQVSLSSGKLSNPDIGLGFSIQIVSWGSSPSFTGTVAQSPSQSRTWQGQFVIVDETPLATLLSPPVTIPQDILNFLNISCFVPEANSGQVLQDAIINFVDTPIQTPIPVSLTSADSGTDQARKWGDDIFADIMLHSLSAEGQKDFFQNLGPLGTFFASNDLPGGKIPSNSPVQASSGPLSLSSIMSDNKNMFQYLGVHFICYALKSSSWLDSSIKDCITDLASQFVNMLICPTSELSANEQAYGTQKPLVASGQIPALRTEYRDAAVRCYLAAWVSFCPQLNAFTSTTAQSMYDRVTATVRSPSYQAHDIQVDIDATSSQAAGEFSNQLGMLHDKLVLLKLLTGITTVSSDWETCVQDINTTISNLQDGGAATGFFGQTNMKMRAEDFRLDLKIGEIFTDQDIWNQWVNQATMGRIVAVRWGYIPSPEDDPRSDEANQYLLNSAESLGLYVEPPSPSPSCVIL